MLFDGKADSVTFALWSLGSINHTLQKNSGPYQASFMFFHGGQKDYRISSNSSRGFYFQIDFFRPGFYMRPGF